MIKKFENFKNKSIVIYHGLGGKPASERVGLLESMGHKVICPHIDYEHEWNLDKGKSLVLREMNAIKNVDVIIGFSLGGYLGYLLGGLLGKDLIMINPALDRGKSLLDIKDFDIDNVINKVGNIEVFFGENDTLVPMEDQISFLNKNEIAFKYYIIKGMEHKTPMDKFEEIVKMSQML